MAKIEKGQCEVNIGIVGHVDHGKTTIVQALSGEWTDRHSEEMKRGISIKLGYADVQFLKCPSCNEPQCYTTSNLCEKNYLCPKCKTQLELLRRISFVDAPGHEILMATMISGSFIMDGACLVIAVNEDCPQPQTREHLEALKIAETKNLVIAQNKVELRSNEDVTNQYHDIKEFIKGSFAENAPIIPISAIHKANLDALIQALETHIPTPERDTSKPARMYVARSFDVNKPGAAVDDLVGGVIGVTISEGMLNIDDEIEIRPGLKTKEGYKPMTTTITSLYAGGNIPLEKALPGGLIGVGTLLDPSLTKADGLIGHVAGIPGSLPETRNNLELDITLLERVVGVKRKFEDLMKTERIKVKEPLMLNVGISMTVGVVTSTVKDHIKMTLKRPVCTDVGQRVAISRQIAGRWRLIGFGIVT
ncbi:MAG: translation initiation factor IF-2 subunit gamma [Candidatus Helarchaeota archaeon]|nr:translation initiation factor IF-2 subunit gamma [Candidatus Helarchaeota archaeon]